MRDLELEDDHLDQTQRESGTAVHDVVGSHVLEVDTLLAFCGAGQPLSGENLKELDASCHRGGRCRDRGSCS